MNKEHQAKTKISDEMLDRLNVRPIEEIQDDPEDRRLESPFFGWFPTAEIFQKGKTADQ